MKKILFTVLLMTLISHSGSAQAEGDLGAFWKLPFLPLTLHVGTDGVELYHENRFSSPGVKKKFSWKFLMCNP